MSEDRTQNLPNDDLRQILAQLTSINGQLGDVRTRLERLEARGYDTKPIWENALKEIAETRTEMREGFEQINARVGKLETTVDKLETTVGKLQAEVRESRAEATAEMRKVTRQIDVLNHNLLEIQGELRSVDDRLLKLEPQPAQ
jgi:chromosome segregation ATPase